IQVRVQDPAFEIVEDKGLRMSNHRIRVIVETDGYTDWWVANRQRRTRKELEADRRNEVD
ncbi:MAG: hypothetical protein M3069_01885, partial [Chloroflexota bacterium]|nr:hypothetical protein [Chloroflexota bacterium]